MTFHLTISLFQLVLCGLAAYGFVRMVSDVFGVMRDALTDDARPALVAGQDDENDPETDADLDLALAEHGVTVETDEEAVTVTTVDGVRISGPELTFELPESR